MSTKICNRCKIEKSSLEFNFRLKAKGWLQHICKACWAIRAKEYAANHRKVISSASRKYRERHPERAKAISRKWYAENRLSVRRRYNLYRLRTLPEHAEKSARRRRGQKASTPKWANIFFMQEAYRLAKLRSSVTGIEWQVDHVVPLKSDAVCGLHCEHNLRVIPAFENMSKGNRTWPDMP